MMIFPANHLHTSHAHHSMVGGRDNELVKLAAKYKNLKRGVGGDVNFG